MAYALVATVKIREAKEVLGFECIRSYATLVVRHAGLRATSVAHALACCAPQSRPPGSWPGSVTAGSDAALTGAIWAGGQGKTIVQLTRCSAHRLQRGGVDRRDDVAVALGRCHDGGVAIERAEPRRRQPPVVDRPPARPLPPPSPVTRPYEAPC